MTTNPFLKNTSDIWYKAHQHIKDTPSNSRFLPIWGNMYFRTGRADGAFKIWLTKVYRKLKTYIWMVVFSHLISCVRHITIFFEYLPLKHFILSKYRHIISQPPLSHIENLTLLNLNRRSQISLFYTALMYYAKESTIDRLEAWKLEARRMIALSWRAGEFEEIWKLLMDFIWHQGALSMWSWSSQILFM